MKRIATIVAASLAGGVGIGIGQGLVGAPPFRPAWAQGTALTASSSEENVIRVVRQVRPTVVSVKRQGGSGTGVVIRRDGLILTNAHVVGSAKQVGIQLADGRKLQGQVAGVDSSVDIAVVKVNAKDLPEARLADSDRLEVGQEAIAIGNPLGLDGTVTTGVVSAVNRQRGPDDFIGFVQTDAAINPGNSGGPLLDSQGRVVGINSWIIGNANGLGFAVPINVARDVARQVMETGTVRRAILGIRPSSVTPELASKMSLPVTAGALVMELVPDSPAEKAGVQAQDIITQVNGQTLVGSGDLFRILRSRKAGDRVTLTIRRGGQTLNLAAELVEAPQ